MEDLTLQLKDSFNIISLVLVFAFVLFDIRYPQIQKELKKLIPDKTLVEERKFFRTKLKECLLYKNSILILIYGLLLYLFLPLLIRVLKNSRFEIWNFELIHTAFILIIGLIFVFFLWSIYLAIKLILKIQKCK